VPGRAGTVLFATRPEAGSARLSAARRQAMGDDALRILILGLAILLFPQATGAQGRPPAPPPEQLARPGNPGWSIGAGTGCWIWNASPRAGETAIWSGECPLGPAEGPGVLEMRHAGKVQRFEGGLVRGRAEGKATLIMSDGARYEGDWRAGAMHGFGILTTPQGARYEGQWERNRQHGRGVFSDRSGTYDGEFRFGRQNGKGVMTFADGSRYEGEWKDGWENGQGILKERGVTYEGTFLDARLNGRGTARWANGEHYEGDWIGGLRQGQGVFTWANGDRAEGLWFDDRPEGPGEFWHAARKRMSSGTWTKGCFRAGDGTRAAFDKPLGDCK